MKRRTKADWRALIEQQTKSDLSVAEFCKQHQIGATYFYKRKSELSKEGASKRVSPFVKVNQVKPGSSTNNTIKILHRNTRLSLPIQVSPDWLAQFIKALK